MLKNNALFPVSSFTISLYTSLIPQLNRRLPNSEPQNIEVILSPLHDSLLIIRQSAVSLSHKDCLSPYRLRIVCPPIAPYRLKIKTQSSSSGRSGNGHLPVVSASLAAGFITSPLRGLNHMAV